MKDILSEIIAHKRFEVESQKRSVSMEQLKECVQQMEEETGNTPIRRSMKQALASSSTGIIAEFKRRSPSKGWIHREARPEEIAVAYSHAGASALSILTDETFFGGNLRDIRAVRALTSTPVLRKDFIIDEYQLYQARIVGADAVLLIAAALSAEQCHELEAQAHRLGLEVLLEIHSAEEKAYITPQTDMVGVNNRHLGSFVTDVSTSFRLAEQLPKNALWVSESGISSPETVSRLRDAGFRGFLIGEAFMKTPSPGDKLKEFISHL